MKTELVGFKRRSLGFHEEKKYMALIDLWDKVICMFRCILLAMSFIPPFSILSIKERKERTFHNSTYCQVDKQL